MKVLSPPVYDVILADPPWHWRTYAGKELGEERHYTRGAPRHYPIMPTEDICKLLIPSDKNAVLFLWAIWPKLPDALRVIEAWGFEYKTIAWAWVKANRSGLGFFTGMGFYTRANTEPCLLAVKGRKPVARHDIQSLIYHPVMEHSRKPDDQYRKIEALYPNMHYLELFARRKREGWDSWGNEVKNDIVIPMQSVT